MQQNVARLLDKNCELVNKSNNHEKEFLKSRKKNFSANKREKLLQSTKNTIEIYLGKTSNV